MSRITWVVAPLSVFLGLACGGGGGAGGSSDWPSETTWTCGGGDVKQMTGITKVIETKDIIAIEAAGSCQLTLVNCDITADFPIKAAGNAKVTIKGGRIHGKQQAIQAWGNAVVTIEGAMIEGDKATTGNGKIIEH
ncbi:MAG: hypothetical protein H6735_26010 [Alphaproteobacteria bacterium]|nr:hypothetical protein [Alphaproteobacteria bacterium]